MILYFTLQENSRSQASLGKRVLKLKVTDQALSPATLGQLLVRNLLKFLPWEIAHFGVHQVIYYNRQSAESPARIWIALILAQVLALIYLVGIFLSRDHRALYELCSGTRVVNADSNQES